MTWTPKTQQSLNSDIDKRLGSLEAQLSGQREELEAVIAMSKRSVEIIEMLLEALSQQRG